MLENIQFTKTVNKEKKMVDKLVEECTETDDEITLITSAKITLAGHEKEYKCSCTIYVFNIFNNPYNQHWNWYLFYLLQIHEL